MYYLNKDLIPWYTTEMFLWQSRSYQRNEFHGGKRNTPIPPRNHTQASKTGGKEIVRIGIIISRTNECYCIQGEMVSIYIQVKSKKNIPEPMNSHR